ncbi:MAG TPA: aminotransferase class III-fold pyridoxal phosphate-dependent enzyme [Steroidobacteraceae bacterium]|jgi:glutamate-1-semialdehyde 2,1-aminomutase|nr:aminotransferase class III-fold pyridoxal phosphate-dependent enzyme [Steroidobacteraceae bacterium]
MAAIPPRRSFSESARYHAAATQAIAGGVNSNVRLGAPLCFARAAGAHLTDIDGNTYIDYALGMGPAVLGHAHPRVIEAARRSLALGQMYAGQHPAELDLAELVKRLVPSAELVRFGMTGSEMIQAALRVARSHTGRAKIVKFEGHYHGWFDNVLAGAAADAGGDAPRYTAGVLTSGQMQSGVADLLVLPWNSIDALAHLFALHGREVAAVLMEPMMCNTGAILPRPGYLEAARRLCDEHGSVLIFDEVITGFRLGLAGAQGRFGVRPDLSTFAKAVGAGFPLALLAGRADIMSLIGSGRVNHSGTYNSNVMSIAAGIAALEVLAENDGHVMKHIDVAGQALMNGLKELGCKHGLNLQVSGVGAVFNTAFTDQREVHDFASFRCAREDRLNGFLQGLLARGIRPTSRGTWFVSAAHSESDIDATLIAADAALGEIQDLGK